MLINISYQGIIKKLSKKFSTNFRVSARHTMTCMYR